MSPLMLRKDYLEHNHSEIVSCLKLIESIRASTQKSSREILRHIEMLEERGFNIDETLSLWSQIAELLAGTDHIDTTLNYTQQEQLIRVLGELRLRVISVAFLHSQSFETHDNSALSLWNTDGYSPSIMLHCGEVVSAFCKATQIILLPAIETSIQEHEASKGLLEVFDITHSNTDWMVDFSAIKNISLVFLGIIHGYRESLRKKGGELSICWLHDNVLRSTLPESMRTTLGLVRIADHWFSQPK